MAMSDCRILFVDDDKDILSMVEQYLKMQGYNITTVDSGLKALDLVKEQGIDIVFTDYKMPEFNGLELLAAIKQYRPAVEVVVVTGYGSMESAIQAMKFGSYDYMQKPFKLDHLKLIIDRITEEKKVKDKSALIRKRVRERYRFEELIGINPRMQQIYELIENVAHRNVMVLLQGESGTGKELVARTIHRVSERGAKPFVPVNCSSVTGGMPEQEVNGYVGALMEKVDGGTLYLDEIAELDPSLRMLLLQALKFVQQKQEEQVQVIAATSKELSQVVASGALKKDFFDLLNAVIMRLPPLRERREDICPLIHHFIFQACTRQNKRVISVSPGAFDILMRYHWPGNLIQLQNVIDRALALGVTDSIGVEDLPSEIQTFSEISRMG